MKNNYARFKLIALTAVIIFLYALTIATARAKNLQETAQQQVRGVVKDQNDLPIPGVSVLIKGTNQGTITNLDGEYALMAGEDDVLLFSFLGFKPREVRVNDRSEIDVVLKEEATALNEVEINAGYYNTTRRESTGNISRVTAEEIEMQPVVSPLQALQGRMAGVEIIPGGSHPGMAPTIRIRGRNSLREDGNLPLYIIDGVPVISTSLESNSLLGGSGIDPLSTLNLANIQSIEVLKDADATAIYGSRGANGVVLITTKKGWHGDEGLRATVYTGASWMPNRLDLLNTEQYLEIRRQAFENDGVEPTTSNAVDLLVWDQEAYTDWQDEIFGGTAQVRDMNISASEVTENTSFRLGGSYHEQGTIYPGDFDYQKVTAAVSINHLSENERLALDLSVNYGLDNISSIGNTGLDSEAFYLPPNAPPIFNDDGSLHWEGWSEAGWNNPYEGFFNTSTTKNNNLVSNLGITYEILRGLSIKSSFGYTYFDGTEVVLMPKRSYNPSSWEYLENASLHLDNIRSSWIVEPQINYDRDFGRFDLSAIVGSTFQESKYGTTGFEAEGYVSESLIGNLAAAETLFNGQGINSTYRYAAIFGRLGLNWDQKYFLNFTGRRDGSSRFGPGNKFANFGAIGTAWVFSEEPFFKDKDSFLSFGKLRASYGTTGSDQIGDYGYLDAYEATPGPGGLYPTQLSNPLYSWEINRKLAAGLEVGFFDDRMNVAATWFRNRSSNQLVGYVLPATTGFTTIQANLPATVQNTGIELEISSTNVENRNFEWRTFFNMTFPRNELIVFPDIEQSSYANIYKVGHPLNIDLLYQFDGIDPDTGFYRIVDVNGDERYDHEDRVVIRDLQSNFFGGFSNDLRYKSFSLQFLLDFAKQEGSLDMFNAGAFGNQRAVVLEALNGSNKYQRISASSMASRAYRNALETLHPVVDASFLRLKTLSLGYNIPPSILANVTLKDVRIFVNGQNLLTLTNYEGMDPELPDGGYSFAALRTITGGFQLQF